MARAIVAVTGGDTTGARRQLWHEFLARGGTVRRAAKERGVTWYTFDDAMVSLYSESNAFLHELAVWNLNLLKRSMRAWVTRWVTRVLGTKQRVLTWGDGLGFDSLSLAEAGHDVSCFDLPGSTSTFAQRMLAAGGAAVAAIGDPDDLPEAAFDAVVCLDVLEHVPDLGAELARLRACLRPGGVLIVHAPFYFVHRASITHLRMHQRRSGSLALFREAGFSLLDGQPTWAPLVFVRSDGRAPRRPWLAWPRLAIALPFGLFLAVGRWTPIPAELTNIITRLLQPWFLDDMLGRGAPDGIPPGADP